MHFPRPRPNGAIRNALPEGHLVARLLDEHSQLLHALDRLDALTGASFIDPSDPDDRIVLEEIRDFAARLVHPTGHEAREERVLIPAIARNGLTAFALQMHASHVRMRQRTDQLRKSADGLLAGGAGTWAELRSTARELIASLRAHIEEEERDLFPAALESIREEAVWAELSRAGEDRLLT